MKMLLQVAARNIGQLTDLLPAAQDYAGHKVRLAEIAQVTALGAGGL
jgi:hypothetical protein